MSKLTDIKYRINQLDGGAFQNLCDVYLRCRGYGTGYSLGMYTGTDKTAKGNPDTYFLTTNNHYVLAMYTTQKTDFLKKAYEDIRKCFDSAKTGLMPEKVVEIVYCHTYGRLSSGEHRALHQFCEKQNTALTLIGVDELADDLYLKYSRIAKDFLDINVDTSQITSMSEFIQIHDATKTSAPLNTEFLFREEEFDTAMEKLRKSDVLVISGSAGVGKTRLALRICEKVAENNECSVLCIKSNGLELYEDLTAALELEKDYLVFVDDANELTGLHFVLDYLPKVALGKKCIRKVVVTVRDYARNQVTNQILEVEKPEILKLGLLTDDNINELMEAAFGITNRVYLERINVIAQGNARLAMLAGKLAAETKKIDSIRDASELYEHYYGKQIGEIAGSGTGVVSVGIMAFFQVLRLDYMERLEPIFTAMKISEDQFIADLKRFHEIELVDICHDKAVKISDQSFSNYLIKHVFIDKKKIPLSKMIEWCFLINKERTISTCNILMNVFSDVRVQKYVVQQINCVWDEIQSDVEQFPPFFRAFHMIRPTETLLLLKNEIDQELLQPFNIHTISFTKTENEKNITDNIINILCSFSNHLQLPEAIDLLMVYYQKHTELFEQVYSALVSRFGVDKDSSRYGYFTQKIVVERLCATIKATPCDANLLLLVRVSERFLKFNFSTMEGGRGRTYTYYTMSLTAAEPVLKYRSMLLEQLFEMYEHEKCQMEIESLLMDYCTRQGAEIDYEIVRYEFEFILRFFTLFSPDNLYHCVIAEHIENIARRIKYDCKNVLKRFLQSRKYKIYYALKAPSREKCKYDFQKNMDLHKMCVKKLVQNYDLPKFRYLLQVCKECMEKVDKEARLLSTGITYAMEALSTKHELYIELVKNYMIADTPYDVHVDSIISNLFMLLPAEEVSNLITSCDFSQKNTWLWEFYAILPEKQITIMWADELLGYLREPAQKLRASPYRTLDQIKKYECVDEEIIVKASRIIAEHYDESPFVFNLYFSLMLNPDCTKKQKVVEQYKNELPLLEDIYLKNALYSENEDGDGELLEEIIKMDPHFLSYYLENGLSKVPRSGSNHDACIERLSFVWKSEDFVLRMNEILDYLLEKAEGRRRIDSSVIEYLLLRKEDEADVGEKQEKWIQNTIKERFSDERRMYVLFNAIADHDSERRKCALRSFLELNSDYSFFESLPLEASSWGGCGSMISHMQERITHLTALLPMLSGLAYLRHKQKVERDIDVWESRIRNEEIQELLDSL